MQGTMSLGIDGPIGLEIGRGVGFYGGRILAGKEEVVEKFVAIYRMLLFGQTLDILLALPLVLLILRLLLRLGSGLFSSLLSGFRRLLTVLGLLLEPAKSLSCQNEMLT